MQVQPTTTAEPLAPPAHSPGRRALTHAAPLRGFVATVVALSLSACRDQMAPTSDANADPSLVVATTAVSWRQIAAGWQHTCAVTTANVAYCWGANASGQLGDGTRTVRLRPVKVLGALRFLEIRAGESHTCGVTTDSLAYCWGSGQFGELGSGSTAAMQLTPKLVAGGRKWRQVSPGTHYTCGVTAGSAAYCWGNNDVGQMGVSGISSSTVPVRVTGDLKWRRVVAGSSHTCATTTGDRGYCWGYTWARTPRAVPGTTSFRQVLPGSGHILIGSSGSFVDNIYTCGVTTADRLYCDFNAAKAPTTAIAPTRAWLYVNPGGYHTCGLTRAGGAFCWGNNEQGGLGTGGASAGTSTPIQVAGGRTYRGLSASVEGFYTCGVTTDNRAFCWGDNESGQLGDGTRFTDRFTPVAVVNPL